MGAKTFSTIVSEGMLLAGRDDLATEVGAWLKDWLRQTYLSWPWPFLHRSRSALSLASGAASLTVGGGNGGVTPKIQKVLDPIWVYTSTGGIRTRARIRHLTGGNDPTMEERGQLSTWTGIPAAFRVRPDTSYHGVWNLIPLPTPDRDYLLAFDYIELPDDPADGDYPLYPNDMTLVNAASVATLLYANGADDPGYADSLQLLARRTAEDRARFGNVPGINDAVGLDEGIFR